MTNKIFSVISLITILLSLGLIGAFVYKSSFEGGDVAYYTVLGIDKTKYAVGEEVLLNIEVCKIANVAPEVQFILRNDGGQFETTKSFFAGSSGGTGCISLINSGGIIPHYTPEGIYFYEVQGVYEVSGFRTVIVSAKSEYFMVENN